MDWNANWDEVVGLWQKPGPGHVASTKDLKIVHPGPEAASYLLCAARKNVLQEIDSERVLETLHKMQWKENDDMRGCIKWYFEEEKIGDSNAAFFTGLNLIILRIRYYDLFTEKAKKLLDTILAGLNIWFRNAAKNPEIFYPNKYLGDLVCKWLITEILGMEKEDEFLPDQMRIAAKGWRESSWGWGEHLSDIYGGVCLHELSILLLLAKNLPEDIRQAYLGLASDLLAIEDGFDNGPRVPALRCYSFTTPPKHTNYRDLIKADTEDTIPRSTLELGDLLNKCSWHEKMPPRQKGKREFSISCFNGSKANAFVEEDIRLGTMSRFPIMPTAEHANWGLAWQSFPAVFSRGTQDWGFLQWETLEEGKLRAHPANGGPMAHIPKALSDAVEPPLTGETFSIQHGGNALIVRVMRCIPKSWEAVTDRFRLIAPSGEAEEKSRENWHQLLLHYPQRDVSVNFIPFTACKDPVLLRKEENILDWNHALTDNPPPPYNHRILVHLWGISLDGEIDAPPEITIIDDHCQVRAQGEQIRELDWKWKNIHWHVNIDPLRGDILREIEDHT